MSAFDKVIGYDAIKRELMEICDMVKNRSFYTELGADLPQGILLDGDPGLGKTLMAKCFLEECNLTTYTIRRNKSTGDFVAEITDTFTKAAENAPSIIFLDDMDKFANEDYSHRDTEEYVAIQSGIDEVKGKDVFVIATTNDYYKLPDSLVRAGRFDKKICVRTPNDNDAYQIIEHYLSNKKVSEDVNMNDLVRMFSYSSCAELESIINEAAISAASRRKDSIQMEDIVNAVLRSQYDSPDDFSSKPEEEMNRIALHEAGHLVVSEIITPESVGLASIRSNGNNENGGFVHLCKKMPVQFQHAYIGLAGKVAVELYYADACTLGCDEDLNKVIELIEEDMTENASCGISMLDLTSGYARYSSDAYKTSIEAVVRVELERVLIKTREILLKNREFLEKTAKALAEKQTLLYSDIQRIRNECSITEVSL